MTWIPNGNSIDIGDEVRLTRDIKTISGTMKAGTVVTCIGADGYRGYDFKDSEGHRIIECGFEGFEKI